MKKILCTLSVLLLLNACGKNDPILEERMIDGEVKIYDSANQEFFTGYVENTKINNQGISYVAEKMNVKNGEKDGEYSKYDSKGILVEKANYKSGNLDGRLERYDPSTNEIKEFLNYDNGILNGEYKKYTLMESFDMDYRQYSTDFNIEKGQYKNGEKDGDIEYYYGAYRKKDKGLVLFRKESYKNGKKEGISYDYYPNGDKLRRISYKNGFGNGYFERYAYSDGRIIHRGHLYKGNYDGNIYVGSYFEKYPIISLEDYKEEITDKFTFKDLIGDESNYKDELKIEYYPNGKIKKYLLGINNVEYPENFKILELLDDIKAEEKIVSKAKNPYDLEKTYVTYQDLSAVLLGLYLSKGITEKEKEEIEIVRNSLKELLIKEYIKKREIAIEY